MSLAFRRFLGENGLGSGHLVAALFGAVAVVAAGALLRPFAPPAACFVLGALTAAIAFEDWRALRVPDLLNLLLLVSGVVVAFEAEGWGEPARLMARILLDVVVCGGALWLVRTAYRRLTGRDGLGLGDIKFAAAAAPWIGWTAFPYLVLIASLFALGFVAAAAALRGGWPSDRRLPFASFLAPSLALAWLVFGVH